MRERWRVQAAASAPAPRRMGFGTLQELIRRVSAPHPSAESEYDVQRKGSQFLFLRRVEGMVSILRSTSDYASFEAHVQSMVDKLLWQQMQTQSQVLLDLIEK